MRPNAKRFLAPELLQVAAEQVAAAAKREGIPAVLIGGYAMQLYGSDRLTGDVDFAVAGYLMDFRGKKLSFGGLKTKAPNGVPLDLIVRNDDYSALYEEAIEHPVEQTVRGGRFTGVMVVRPEYLAAIKMAANREKDHGDLEQLIQSGALNRKAMKETRRIIREYLGPYAADEFDQTVEIAKWRKSRGE